MAESSKNTTATVIPGMRYKDAPEAIKWLCKAFGFKEHLVVPNEDDTIAHAQLTFGNGMIMVGSVRDDELHHKPPSDLGGYNSQIPYIIVKDIDKHYNRALKAGAEIVTPLIEQDYGGKLYSCKDPEGYLWNFGSYNPWDLEN